MPRLLHLAPLALLGLAACDQGPATVTPYRHPSGAFDFLVAATRNGGPLYLELAGDPFGTGEDLESHVVAAMEPALQSRVLRLTRSEEHTSELQSLMRISYAVFCLKKKKKNRTTQHNAYKPNKRERKTT